MLITFSEVLEGALSIPNSSHAWDAGLNPFDPSRYYSAAWKQSILLAVWDKKLAGSQ
jgi:hypothetical protein